MKILQPCSKAFHDKLPAKLFPNKSSVSTWQVSTKSNHSYIYALLSALVEACHLAFLISLLQKHQSDIKRKKINQIIYISIICELGCRLLLYILIAMFNFHLVSCVLLFAFEILPFGAKLCFISCNKYPEVRHTLLTWWWW